jgi:redox-sensitive bicupin YhaK (pirin superfamily)
MTPLRTVLSTHRGVQHGPIWRLLEPTGLGQALKPFVLLDFFHAPVQPGFGFGMHPHSGIATLTWQPDCDVRYQDTTGQRGVLKAGGLEWMNAGGGAWHQGSFETEGLATGFQLWVAMPPGVEEGASFGQYVPPDAVPTAAIEGGRLTLLLGQLQAGDTPLRSPIESHQDMHYFVLDLAAHAQWRYNPPTDHTVAWAFVFEGHASLGGASGSQDLWVLSQAGDIEIATADAPARVLIGSARPHPHPLVLGASSVHTSAEALRQGHARIRAIGASLAQQGLIGR